MLPSSLCLVVQHGSLPLQAHPSLHPRQDQWPGGRDCFLVSRQSIYRQPQTKMRTTSCAVFQAIVREDIEDGKCSGVGRAFEEFGREMPSMHPILLKSLSSRSLKSAGRRTRRPCPNCGAMLASPQINAANPSHSERRRLTLCSSMQSRATQFLHVLLMEEASVCNCPHCFGSTILNPVSI